MKVALLTLGCRVNQSESDVIQESLQHNGVTIVSLQDNPDYCIVNSCTITGKSDYHSRQIIRRAAKNGAKVIVTGCYSQLRGEEARGLPGVISLVDIRDKYDIVNMICKSSAEPSYDVSVRSRPFLKVQDGCNFNCSYCTVPLARGRSRSVPPGLLVDRAKALVEKGFHEIVLTGIHLGTYGQDLPARSSLAGLVKSLLSETLVHRLRLSSIEINEIDDELLELLEDTRICRNLHIPLQSGSDKILGLMRRGYRAGHYIDRLESLSARLGRIAFGTDVIAGFPQEGEPEFRETERCVEALPFTYLHVFPYSARPGTDAASMPGRPGAGVVKERTERLHYIGNQKKMRYMTEHIGKDLEFVLEEKSVDGLVIGTSSNYLKIGLPEFEYACGSLAIARPLRVEDEMLHGVLVTKS